MMDFLEKLFSTDTGFLVAAIAAAWRYFAGPSKGTTYEGRVKEIANAAFMVAGAVTGRTPTEILMIAKREARVMLERLKIPFSSTVAALLDHELDVLYSYKLDAVRREEAAVRVAAAHLDGLASTMGKVATELAPTFAAAEARGRARVSDVASKVELEMVPGEEAPQ